MVNETEVKAENNDFKVYVPQIAAAIMVLLYNVVIGKSLGYSAILVPQLLNAQNNGNQSEFEIEVSEQDISWIVSVLSTVVLPTSLIAGSMIDAFGRLNTLKFSVVPNALGWILIATARNVPMLIAGRILTGTAIALGGSSSSVYVTEISSPNIRGALISISPCFFTFGALVAYLEGWFLNWRTVAWLSIAYILVPVSFVALWLPESPTWLVTKNRISDAKKSLQWLHKYRQEDASHSPSAYVETQLSLLIKNNLQKQEQSKSSSGILNQLAQITEPTVYKPLTILTILYVLQQFSGVSIFLFYAVTFFDGLGAEVSEYFAGILIGTVRFAMSVGTIFLMKRFGRRPLLMLSGLGMGVAIGVSGLFTDLIMRGKVSQNWIPVVMGLLYTASSIVGVLNIPWTIISELFPSTIRGTANAICIGIAYIIMFCITKVYFALRVLFGGLAGVQYFFGAVSLGIVIYTYIFLPETHNRELSDIQEDFKRRWTFIPKKQTKDIVAK